MMDERLDQAFLTFRCLFGMRMSSQLDGTNYTYDFRAEDVNLNLRHILQTTGSKKRGEKNLSTVVVRGDSYYIFIHGEECDGSFDLRQDTEVLVIVSNGVKNPLESDVAYSKYLNKTIVCIEVDLSGSFWFDDDDLEIEAKTFFHILMTSIGYSLIARQTMSILSYPYIKSLRNLLVESRTIATFGDILLPIVKHFHALWQKNDRQRFDYLFIICQAENHCLDKTGEKTLANFFGHIFNTDPKVLFISFSLFLCLCVLV